MLLSILINYKKNNFIKKYIMIKTKYLISYLTILLLMMLSETNFGQTYGKLYTKTEGEQLYGKVTKSFQFSSEEVNSFLNKTEIVLMFNINDNKLFILGDGRKPIYPLIETVNSEEVFRVFSVSLIQELIEKGKSSITYFEKRNTVLTITNGEYLLEYGLPCPPVCP